MNDTILEEIIQKHDSAEAFISLFFLGIDSITYLIILCLFGCDFNKKLFSHRQKLSLLILLDALFRIIHLYIISFVYSLVKEIIITVFATFQFYLIIILLNQIFTDKNNERFLESLELKFPFLSTIFFFIFAIVLDISKIFSLVQYICAISSIILYAYYVGGKVDLFLKNIEKKNPNFGYRNFSYNLTLFTALYFIIHYFLKIISLMIENTLYSSYMEMICDIFKEVGRYLVFTLVIIIYYLFNKYIKEEDYDYANNSNQGVVNISSVSSVNNK
jgi:hypothetical protein